MSDTDITQIQGPRDLFSIRSQLAQQANPLRAKIVLFSALYHPFAQSSSDWSTLKQQDLGEFIRRVYNKYASFEALQNALILITAQLENPAACDHAAAAILKVLKPYYTEVDADVNTATGTLTDPNTDPNDDPEASQTWDIPIGISLKDVNDQLTDVPLTGELLPELPSSDLGLHGSADGSTTGLSRATTATLSDTSIDLEMSRVDGLDISSQSAASTTSQTFDQSEDFEHCEPFEPLGTVDDDSVSDHSRWLDSPEVNGGQLQSANGLEVPRSNPPSPAQQSSQSSPAPQSQQPKQSKQSKPSIYSEDPSPIAPPSLQPEPAMTPTASTEVPVHPNDHHDFDQDRNGLPQTSALHPSATTPKQNGRRTSLAQLLSQRVSSREEVDAIVQRYSKTLTEQVTTALDNLEDELAECLMDRGTEEATAIAGDALGRVLLSVSHSIEQMRQALESIPGVEPITTSSRLYTPPPQPTPSPPVTNTPEIADAPLPIPITLTQPPESTPPPQTSQPEPRPAIDPVQQINDHFKTLLAKRDMTILVKQRNGCTHLIAEANPLPERQKLVRFVTKNLKQLDLPPIATLRLHGRRKEAHAFDWSEDLPPIG